MNVCLHSNNRKFTQRNFKQNLSNKTCKLLINSFYELNKSLSSQENKADVVLPSSIFFLKRKGCQIVKKNRSKDIIDSLFDRFSAQFCFE